MNTVNLPDEKEFKLWMKEVMVEYFLENPVGVGAAGDEGMILSRKEAAKFLQISLVTLHDWMKKGLPSYKKQGKVYFIKGEVVEYIRGQK